MEITTNKPTVEKIFVGSEEFIKGDRVRVQLVPIEQPEYPFSGGGVIGQITAIHPDSFMVNDRLIPFDCVLLMRKAETWENFNTVPYYNEEERDFWETHWITPNGIEKKLSPMTKAQSIELDWDKALTDAEKTRDISSISYSIDWGFREQDMYVLCCLHEAGKHCAIIEDLLDDCNYHTACRYLNGGEYDRCREWIKEIYKEL